MTTLWPLSRRARAAARRYSGSPELPIVQKIFRPGRPKLASLVHIVHLAGIHVQVVGAKRVCFSVDPSVLVQNLAPCEVEMKA